MLRAIAICGIVVGLAGWGAGAAGAQAVQAVPAQPDQTGTIPVYKVTVVGRTITAVNYHVLGDTTSVKLQGTALLPSAEGKATVKILRGATYIHVSVDHVHPAQRFGPEYLTYVLWAVTPNGRAKNLGEVQLSGVSAKMDVTTTLQDFGLIVTAEPYFAVTQPSDVVVMQNYVTSDTVGAQALVSAKYELLERGQYRVHVDPAEVTELPQDPKVPLDLYEAENAVRIARWAGADQYAQSTYEQAEQQLQQAENYEARDAGKAPVATVARQAVQTAEDARLMTLQRRQQEHEAMLKAATNAHAAAAQAAAQTAEQQTQQADEARREAEAQAQAARDQAAAAEDARLQAEQQRQQAEQQVQAANAQAQQERAKLQRQLGSVLQTRDTASGLIMSMPDVQFGFDQATLVPSAQIKLAKIAGILLSYPDLNVQVNGYTDSVGTAPYNEQLSEKRADAVRSFLISQGVQPSSITAQGMGQSNPVASNATPAGRQQNRRVELVVNGAVIGSPNAASPQNEYPPQTQPQP